MTRGYGCDEQSLLAPMQRGVNSPLMVIGLQLESADTLTNSAFNHFTSPCQERSCSSSVSGEEEEEEDEEMTTAEPAALWLFQWCSIEASSCSVLVSW